MKRPKLFWLGGPPERGEPQLSLDERTQPILWPVLPTHTVVRFPQENGHFVDVELRPVDETVRVKKDDEDVVRFRERWIVTGIAVRRGYVTKAQPGADRSTPVVWDYQQALEGSVSTRAVRRMPLSALVEQALAVVSARTPEQIITAATAPPGRPGRGTQFYRELADSYRAFAAEGKRPVQEIAKRKRVSENLVHQWVFQARVNKFLEESPYSGKRRRGKEQ